MRNQTIMIDKKVLILNNFYLIPHFFKNANYFERFPHETFFNLKPSTQLVHYQKLFELQFDIKIFSSKKTYKKIIHFPKGFDKT
jgi:hypothetical protein